MKKTNMSSPTRGNPYGRTGAPGKATAEQPKPEPPGLDEAGAARALGRPVPAPSPQERTLQAAPPPRPQMPNLDALKLRGVQQQATQGMQGPPATAGMAPRPMPQMPPQAPQTPPVDPRLAQMYARYGVPR
jgi:hypothetical protein